MCLLLATVGEAKTRSSAVLLLVALMLSAVLGVDLALARLSAVLAHPRWMMPVVSGVQRRSARVRDYFWSNYSEFPNGSRRRDASRGWDDSRGDVAPGNKAIVFMCEDEMVECASSPGHCYRDQKSLVVFGGERVHLALAGRDDLCEDAQMALVVHGDGRAQVALARRRSLSERVQVALAVHGDSAARRALSRRFDLCNHARRVLS